MNSFLRGRVTRLWRPARFSSVIDPGVFETTCLASEALRCEACRLRTCFWVAIYARSSATILGDRSPRHWFDYAGRNGKDSLVRHVVTIIVSDPHFDPIPFDRHNPHDPQRAAGTLTAFRNA